MFKYVWIIILGIFWLFWTINTLRELIDDYRYYKDLGSVFKYNAEVSTYIIGHVVGLFFSSLIYFCYIAIGG